MAGRVDSSKGKGRRLKVGLGSRPSAASFLRAPGETDPSRLSCRASGLGGIGHATLRHLKLLNNQQISHSVEETNLD